MQYSPENTFFNKNAGLQALSFIEKRLKHRCLLRTLRNFHLIRVNRPEEFRKKGVLRSFTKFTGRYLRPATLLKKKTLHRCFPMNFAKFLRIPFFTEYLQWLLLPILKYICVWLLLRGSSLEFFPHRTFRFLKNKTKKTPFEYLPFHNVLYHFVFLFFSTSRQMAFALHIKRWY